MTKHIEYDYLRVKITAQLQTTSPLHCGDGNTLPAKEWHASKEKADGTINTVCKDKSGKPYIPAPTLRGSLRDRYKESDKALLFGSSHSDGSMGKIRVYDAISVKIPINENDQYQHKIAKTTLQDGVSIDRITNTAKEHHLFIHEIVPVGALFKLSIEVDRITKEQLKNIIQILQYWNNDMVSALGKGQSRGWGTLQIDKTIKVETLDNKAINKWIRYQKTKQPKWKKELLELDKSTDKKTGSIGFKLFMSSPLLINDHALVSTEKNKPKLEYRRTLSGKAIIPAASLRGLLRTHMAKIVASIAHLQYGQEEQIAVEEITPPLIEELFGKEMQRSLIWLSDAIAKNTTKHKQFFNAVDRFTGGVSNKALYNVVAAQCDFLQGECFLDLDSPRLPADNAWKGLLLLAVRDFMEGDLAIGWGKSRGYGSLRLSLSLPYQQLEKTQDKSEFKQLLNYLKTQKETPQQWIEALHFKIQEEIKNQGSDQ